MQDLTSKLILTKSNYAWSIAKEVFRRIYDGHLFGTAASLSFTTLLALVPFFTVVFSVLALFPIADTWTNVIEAFIFDNFVPAAGETVRNYLHEFSGHAGKLTAVGLIFLVFSSLSLLATIEDAFNGIWQVNEGRNWLQRILIYWALLTLGPILIALSLSMSSALLSMSFLADQAMVENFTSRFLRLSPLLLELIAFVLFYQAIPNVEVRFKHSLYGAIIATILFEITKFSFGFYILNFNSYELIYGALATIPVFMIWIYLCWVVLLVGAQTASILKTGLSGKP